MNNKEEALCKHIELDDVENVRKLLDQGNLHCTVHTTVQGDSNVIESFRFVSRCESNCYREQWSNGHRVDLSQ